jgi:hypothetical protein
MKGSTIVLIGAAVAALLFMGKKKEGEGGTGGSLDIPALFGTGSIGGDPYVAPNVAPSTPIVPSQYLTDLMAKKGSTAPQSSGSPIAASGLPTNFFETTFQSSYPTVMYDSKKGGTQLAVQSAPQQQQLPSIFSKLTGGLGNSLSLGSGSSPSSSSKTAVSSSSSSSSKKADSGNSAGSSSTLHSSMGVK